MFIWKLLVVSVCVSLFLKHIFNMCLSIIVTWNVYIWWIFGQLQVACKICQSIQRIICLKLSHESAMIQFSFKFNDCIKFKVFQGHFSTRKFQSYKISSISHIFPAFFLFLSPTHILEKHWLLPNFYQA